MLDTSPIIVGFRVPEDTIIKSSPFNPEIERTSSAKEETEDVVATLSLL